MKPHLQVKCAYYLYRDYILWEASYKLSTVEANSSFTKLPTFFSLCQYLAVKNNLLVHHLCHGFIRM